MKNGHILIVDDNQDLLDAWRMVLHPHFYKFDSIQNPELLPDLLSQYNYDLILLDMNFKASMNSGNEGLFWIKEILKNDPDQGILVITAYGDIELAVKAMKLGAVDFIQKSWEVDKVLSIVKTACRLQQTKKELRRSQEKAKHLRENLESGFIMVKGPSRSMEKIYQQINKVASTDANILILGENGTGKELVAREIKERSKRNQEMFVTVDLGSLTETLFESELFGYVKGAFTGADTNKPGRIELANGGTLFLDEIGNMAPNMQTKLLSVLQNREIYRLGSHKRLEVDFRLISATNQNLKDAIQSNNFREDLYYRINTITLHIPPLRDRREDIPILVKHYLKQYNEKYEKDVRLNTSSLRTLNDYHWPGNIRELKHVIEKEVILAENSIIQVEDLAGDLKKRKPIGGEKLFDLKENECEVINRALLKCRGNRSKAAKLLGINRSTLYEKIKKYGIDSI